MPMVISEVSGGLPVVGGEKKQGRRKGTRGGQPGMERLEHQPKREKNPVGQTCSASLLRFDWSIKLFVKRGVEKRKQGEGRKKRVKREGKR